jgi:hypothetical protein
MQDISLSDIPEFVDPRQELLQGIYELISRINIPRSPLEQLNVIENYTMIPRSLTAYRTISARVTNSNRDIAYRISTANLHAIKSYLTGFVFI